MFVALETAEPRYNGIFSDILNILTKPKAHIEAREAFGAVYGVIVTSRPAKESDWRKIAALADRYADRMLLPSALTPPPPLQAIECPRFNRLVLLKTAIEIIKRTRMPMYRRVAGLVDKTGEYVDFLSPLLNHYTSVKVVTPQTELYLAQSERMMEELGAPVLVFDDYTALSDCVLILAPDGVSTAEKLSCPVLAKNPPATEQHSGFITDLRIVPSPEISSLCPKGIDPHNFLGAMYEYCDVESVCLPANRMIWQYRDADLTQVVRAVMQTAGALSVF